MNQIRFYPKSKPEEQEWLIAILGTFRKVYGDRVNHITCEEQVLEPGKMVIIDWACAWNRPADVGKQAIVVCTDDQLCILSTRGKANELEAPHCVYRCEDVIPIISPVNQPV